MKTRSAPQNNHNLFSDLSDLSSVSLAPENGASTLHPDAPEESQGRDGGSTKVCSFKSCNCNCITLDVDAMEL